MPHPPHVVRYAVLFPETPNSVSALRFWSALRHEVENLEKSARSDSLELPIYWGIRGPDDSDDYSRVLDDMRARRLDGLFFTSSPHKLENTPLLDEPGIPRVAIMRRPNVPNLSMVWLDNDEFRWRAAHQFAQDGRKRVAVLGGPPTAQEKDWAKPLAAHGLETRPFWLHQIHLTVPESARPLLHLMLRDGQNERPDALVIADDNLLEPACLGIQDAGIRVPEDLEVISHCNFPWPAPASVPVQRLGFDAREIVEACVASLDRQRAGNLVTTTTQIIPRFEYQLKTPPAVSGSAP